MCAVNRKSDSLTSTEQDMLLNVIDKYEDHALFTLALTTGIRREDIVSIEIGNVDLENRKITFWESKKRKFHTVPIAEIAHPHILRYVNTLKKGQKRLFNITGKTAYNRLQKYVEKAQINKKLAFHDLRRTFVKTAKRKGMSIKAIAQILDDKIDTVETWYANLDHHELLEESNKL